jgi:hypothetical protein
MLVRFRSNAGDITMFGDVALSLIRMMGHSGTVPSALLARDIPQALERLKQGVAAAPPPPPQSSEDEDRKEEPPVSLQQRAFPLIELMERCAKNGYDVLWEQQR